MWLGNRIARSRLTGLALAGLAIFGLAAPAASQDVVEAARAALPAAVRDAGVLNVATSLQWAPFAYASESGEAVGIDISLIKVLAAKLGLEPRFEDIKFPSIIPGVQTGRYEVGVNQIGITADRLKVVDLLPYFNSGYGLLIRKGVTGIDVNDLCGKTLALTQGSSQIAVAEELSAKCAEQSKPKIEMVFYPNSADTYLAVANGRGDGFLTARAVGIYISKGNPKLEVAPGALEGRSTLSGIVIGKDSALYEAMQLALESAVEDGSYTAVLDAFGVADGAISLDRIKAGN
jgi:polar amino acid transport system substrate-binding protein